MCDSYQPLGEAEWVERICDGDRSAFEALFRAYYKDLCRFARRYVDSSSAEDLVQDIFLNLWKRRRDWNLKGSLKAYLYGAVRNRALKHLRHRRVREKWEEQEKLRVEPVQEGVGEILRGKELRSIAEELLGELPERRRLIFILSRRHGLTYAEIADTLDISIKTVETQMSRALKFLRARLSSHLPALL